MDYHGRRTLPDKNSIYSYAGNTITLHELSGLVYL